MTPVPSDPLQGLQASSGGVETQPRPAGTPTYGAGEAMGASMGADGLIPASRSVVQSVTPGVPIDPALKEDIKKGIDLESDAMKQRIDAQNDFQTAFAEHQRKLNSEMEKTNAQFDLIEKNRASEMEGVQATFADTIQKLQDSKINPDRIYGGSTGKRILAGIAIAFGEMGKALTGGGTNAALKIIDGAIDRDIKAQEGEIKKLGSEATLQRQMLADIDAKYDDKVVAQKLKRAILLDGAERKALSLAQNLKSEESIAQAQQLIAQLQQKKATALIEAGQMQADKATIQTTTQLLSPASAQGEKAEKAFGQAQKLRSEYNKNPVTLDTIKRKSSMNTLQASKEMDSAGGDLAFIFSYMKMLDPGSTVREGEFANAQNAAGASDRVRNLYNAVIDGTRLNAKQRDDFYNTANAIYQKQLGEQSKVDERYKGLSERSGINPIDVIVELPFEDKKPSDLSATFVPSGNRG